MNVLKNLFIRLTVPTHLDTIGADILTTLPRIICGAMLAFGFGSDKFGMPWTPASAELNLFQVSDWFITDVASFGGVFAEFPKFFAWMGAGSEAIGGLLLLLGLQTRLSSFLLACTMLVATFFQKWGGPVWEMLPALGFLWVAMTGMAIGSGKIGLDHLLSKWISNRNKHNNDVRTPYTQYLQDVKLGKLTCLLVLIFCCSSLTAQINGNGKITIKTLPHRDITALEINYYADITVDANAKGIKIEAEENIIDYIRFQYNGTMLSIDQAKWIEPSKQVKITIGAPNIKSIEQDTWDEAKVINLNRSDFAVKANLGTVILSGEVEVLIAKSKQGNIIANELKTVDASILLRRNAEGIFQVINNASCNIEEGAKLQFVNEPATKSGCEVQKSTFNTEVKYIDVKIKNNSIGRRHFVVVGHKPDGGTFSYGFPMMPYQVKNERWTTGTKIYKENKLGQRTLLVTLTEKDANTTVKIFKK